jgi:hypothetical protein
VDRVRPGAELILGAVARSLLAALQEGAVAPLPPRQAAPRPSQRRAAMAAGVVEVLPLSRVAQDGRLGGPRGLVPEVPLQVAAEAGVTMAAEAVSAALVHAAAVFLAAAAGARATSTARHSPATW